MFASLYFLKKPRFKFSLKAKIIKTKNPEIALFSLCDPQKPENIVNLIYTLATHFKQSKKAYVPKMWGVWAHLGSIIKQYWNQNTEIALVLIHEANILQKFREPYLLRN